MMEAGLLAICLLRSGLIGLFATLYATCFLAGRNRVSGRRAAWWWGAFLVPFLTPVLLAGYRYGSSAAAGGFGKQALYGLLQVCRLAPFAGLVLLAWPRRESLAAEHCRRLASPRGRGVDLDGPGRRLAGFFCACGLVTSMAFFDLELASLLGVDHWTVRLFDAQAGGLPYAASLRLLAAPFCLGSMLWAATLLPMVWLGKTDEMAGSGMSGFGNRCVPWLTAGLLLMALGLSTGWPLMRVLRQVPTGIPSVFRHPSMLRALGVSLLYASCACALAFWAGTNVAEGLSHGRWGWAVLLLPGLLGALVLGLSLAFLLGLPGCRWLRGTPAPAVIALALMLVPYATVFALVRLRSAPAVPLALAALLEASSSTRVRRRGRRLWRSLSWPAGGVCLAVLFWLAYFELTAVAILTPPGFEPLAVRIYNLVHYGQTPALAALLLLACAAPLLLLGLWFWGLQRIGEGRHD